MSVQIAEYSAPAKSIVKQQESVVFFSGYVSITIEILEENLSTDIDNISKKKGKYDNSLVNYHTVINMKIGIVTIIDYTNYGNRLQNYALTTLLQEIADEVVSGFEGYSHQDWIEEETNALKRIIKKCTPFFYQKRKIKPYIYSELMQKRIEKFVRFTNKYTYTFPFLYFKNDDDLRKQINEASFDYFVVGSDQVWNPMYQGKSYEFLRFTEKKKRYSFAASISAENIPSIKKNRYKKYLSEMEYISVREERGAELIYELTGRKADVTLDPTLLLGRDKWKEVLKKPQIILSERYICTYFLGKIPKAVDDFQKRTGLKVHQLNSLEEKELYTLDPGEFLYVLNNAEYILTDSFHAVAFSIILNKEFYVFARKQDGVNNMFSRIEGITKKLGLENRIQNRDNITEQPLINNWDEIEKFLTSERIKSLDKIKNSMV